MSGRSTVWFVAWLAAAAVFRLGARGDASATACAPRRDIGRSGIPHGDVGEDRLDVVGFERLVLDQRGREPIERCAVLGEDRRGRPRARRR